MIGLSLLARFGKSFSFIGLVSATLFFAASLTPSLLPRPYLVQGILSGFALAVGYAVGVLGLWTWLYLELPKPSAKLDLFAKIATTVGTAGVSLAFLRCTKLWQNSIRDRMGMPEVETAYPLRVALIALFTAVGLVLLTRGIVVAWKLTNRQVNRLLPRRVSYVMSTIFVATLAILIANKVLVRLTLDAADEFFLQLDQLVDEGIEQPKEPLATAAMFRLSSGIRSVGAAKTFWFAGQAEHRSLLGSDAKPSNRFASTPVSVMKTRWKSEPSRPWKN